MECAPSTRIRDDTRVYPQTSEENSTALWTHGKQRLHFSSSGVFHAVSSLPMSSLSLKTLKFSEISNTKISVGAAFKIILFALKKN